MIAPKCHINVKIDGASDPAVGNEKIRIKEQVQKIIVPYIPNT